MCVGEEDHEVSMARTVKRRRVMRERSVCRLEGRVRGNIAIAGIPEYEKPWGIWGGTTITKPPSMGDIPVTPNTGSFLSVRDCLKRVKKTAREMFTR